jgi:hypothetical protein
VKGVIVKLRLFIGSLLSFALASPAMASNTWYADANNGNDNNNCLSASAACKTIGHAITLAASGDSIMLAPGDYNESITIPFSLSIVGGNAQTTVINGQGGSVVAIPEEFPVSAVNISGVRITNGNSDSDGGGISNWGQLTVIDSIVGGNSAAFFGGGISTHGGGRGPATLLLDRTLIYGNRAPEGAGIQCSRPSQPLRIYNSAIIKNTATAGNGGGLLNGTGGTNFCSVEITNSTISRNVAVGNGGGVYGPADLNNVTISGNVAAAEEPQNGPASGGGIYAIEGVFVLTSIQNSIFANNAGGNCNTTIFSISQGYNISSDDTCTLGSAGDLNNTDPELGALMNNGGPTQTMALLPGSPAIDAGNPTGCTDGHGHVLARDQRGDKRPGDPKLKTGCDIGAYELQFPK